MRQAEVIASMTAKHRNMQPAAEDDTPELQGCGRIPGDALVSSLLIEKAGGLRASLA